MSQRPICSSSISGSAPKWRYLGLHLRAPWFRRVLARLPPALGHLAGFHCLFLLNSRPILSQVRISEVETIKRRSPSSLAQFRPRRTSFLARQGTVAACPITRSLPNLEHAHCSRYRPCHRPRLLSPSLPPPPPPTIVGSPAVRHLLRVSAV